MSYILFFKFRAPKFRCVFYMGEYGSKWDCGISTQFLTYTEISEGGHIKSQTPSKLPDPRQNTIVVKDTTEHSTIWKLLNPRVI